MSDKLNVAVGAAIKRRRERHGLSQSDLAKALELSRTSVTNIEAGRQPISIKNLYETARVIGISIHDILPEDPELGSARVGRQARGVKSLLNLLDQAVEP